MTDAFTVLQKDAASSSKNITYKKQPQVDLLAVLAGATEPYSAVRGEQALWRAVILQALIDAVSRSTKDEAKRQRQEARRWLASKKDFDHVCDLAGFNPTYIRRQVKSALARDCQWRVPLETAALPQPTGICTPVAPTHYTNAPLRNRLSRPFLAASRRDIPIKNQRPQFSAPSLYLAKLPH